MKGCKACQAPELKPCRIEACGYSIRSEDMEEINKYNVWQFLMRKHVSSIQKMKDTVSGLNIRRNDERRK